MSRNMEGMYRVVMHERSMGAGIYASSIIIDLVSKTVANNIARYYQKQVPYDMDIYYEVINRDDLEPDISHWR
jgi:hypothetical protein